MNFRSFAIDEAESRGLTGFVGNDPAYEHELVDSSQANARCRGHVTGEAQGDDSKIQDYLKALEKGPSAARVSKVEHEKIEAKSGEKGFGSSD